MKTLYKLIILFIIISCKTLVEEYETETLPPEKYESDTIRLLAIGNSFSEDALEHNLYNIAKASNKVIIIGNLYYGGASLEFHWHNYTKNNSIYRFFYLDKNGKRYYTENFNINNAINFDKWDYISLQQVSNYSGIISSFDPYLNNLINEIKKDNLNLNTKFILHQTWAYQKNSTHPGFINYKNDQMNMYENIVNTYIYWSKSISSISFIIPDGTAIQNGRATYLGDNFNRDGYHLNERGQFVVACTWFEKLFNIDIRYNNFKPNNVKDYELIHLRNAAHNAVINPNSITTE